jgi:hypothetical protein
MEVGCQCHAPAALPPVLTEQGAGWASGPVWMGAKNLATNGIRSPDRPARTESLNRQSYPGHLNGYHFEDQDTDGKTILRSILHIHSGRAQKGLSWLRIRKNWTRRGTRFHVSASVQLSPSFSGDVTPCRLVAGCRRFGNHNEKK